MISPWDEEGFSSCSACPYHRAVATTPPEWMAVSISFRRSMLPSPYGCGLGLWGFALSGPPMRSLSLRPGDSLTSLKDCFVDGLQILGFPPICHPSYRIPDSYPGRTNSCRTCQPLLDTQPDKRISQTSGSSVNHSDYMPAGYPPKPLRREGELIACPFSYPCEVSSQSHTP